MSTFIIFEIVFNIKTIELRLDHRIVYETKYLITNSMKVSFLYSTNLHFFALPDNYYLIRNPRSRYCVSNRN